MKWETPLRALVVDDDPVHRVIIQAILKRRGVEAEFAENAEDGLGFFQENPHDILLVDRKLPGISGLEMTRRVRSLAPEPQPQILLITGAGGEKILEEALDSGVDDYLAKPIDPEALNIRVAIAERRVRDARSQLAREAELARSSLTDPLTGLATRALLRDRVQGGLFRSQRELSYVFAFLQLDLDDFGRVKEALGEEAAAAILQEAARRVEASIRSVDIAGRIAADEFGIFLDDLGDGSDVTRVTNRLKERFAEPILVGEQRVFVSCSMGIALSGPNYSDAEEVFKDASRALIKAKQEGPGGVRIFDPVLHKQASARLEMETRIREALEQDEMVLHYQPIVSLIDPRIVGLEALIRWPKPDGSWVPLEDFLPVAERSGLIAHLGWWTIERACRQLSKWHAMRPEDPRIAVSVNVPGRQLSEPELAPSVLRILEKTGLDGEYLHLEITESSAMADLKRSEETFKALKNVGVHLHVDDFGTGYSSLSYLHRFPVDSLKVDRSFVSGMPERPENNAIVRTVVGLARNLGLSVVVEGIETKEQLAFAQELGCDYGQGWLFAKAMDAREVSMILQGPEAVLRPLKWNGRGKPPPA
jgi:diguanylate cyclase (GGDEF)-like protein